MNQRQALEALVIFVREQEPEDREVLKALKWGDKRLEVLRDREERRKIPIDTDLTSEPLSIDDILCIQDLAGTFCRGCLGIKNKRKTFCVTCYMKVPPGTRKALWSFGSIYYHAYNRAVRFLDEKRKSGQ